MGNRLERHFRRNRGRLIHKWLHYFDIYDRHFRDHRGRPVTVVEFGVYHGGSLQMWKKYFGRRARIIGVDIDPRTLTLVEPQIEVIVGDQDDRDFLKRLREQIGPIDIVIDDGGHRMTQQIATFEEMWPGITTGGVFLAEDVHTSYWHEYGGGYLKPDTFVEYTKNMIDKLHAWHDPDHVPVGPYTTSIRGMHVYDSIIVFDKGNVLPPAHERTGRPSFD